LSTYAAKLLVQLLLNTNKVHKIVLKSTDEALQEIVAQQQQKPGIVKTALLKLFTDHIALTVMTTTFWKTMRSLPK